MENLERVIQLNIGIFTNIGSAHDEFFNNKKEKILEKLKLFKNVKGLVYCADDQILHSETLIYFKENNSTFSILAGQQKVKEK